MDREVMIVNETGSVIAVLLCPAGVDAGTDGNDALQDAKDAARDPADHYDYKWADVLATLRAAGYEELAYAEVY